MRMGDSSNSRVANSALDDEIQLRSKEKPRLSRLFCWFLFVVTGFVDRCRFRVTREIAKILDDLGHGRERGAMLLHVLNPSSVSFLFGCPRSPLQKHYIKQ